MSDFTDLTAKLDAAGIPYREIGPTLLVNGDCLEVLPLLEAGSVNAVVTDPPYGIALKTKTNDYRGGRNFDRGKSLKASVLYQDDPDTIRTMIPLWVNACRALASRCLFFTGPAMLFAYPEPDAVGVVFTPNGAGRCAWGFQCIHPIAYYGRDPYLANGLGGRPNSFRTEQPNKEKIDHQCPKPVEWMAWAVNRVTTSLGDTIIDPFLGSGTTSVACIRTGRRCIGIELEENYFRIAVNRVRKAWREKCSELPFETPPVERQLGLLGD